MNTQIVIAWSTILGIAALAIFAVWILRYWSHRPQHSGGGEGALTVRYLAMRIEAETSGGGRHRLREPTTTREAPADEQTRTPLPHPEDQAPVPDEWTRDPTALHRILTGLRRC
ncbi:hypothetical protein ACH347_17665 [Saccharopolyspora sp. 5N102]|uniref:hypothetical protein n=1 Tax=Saccharopolyspora sp. 5N102 TaxID=3375155 RepID=UPI0037AEE62F